jgi:hypothetical protein
MEQPTNRELKIMVDNLTQRFEEKHNDVMVKLEEISTIQKESLKEAKSTNGKVAGLIWWKNSFVWALGALWALILIAFPVLRQIVRQEIKSTVDISISNALKDYGTENN